MAARPRIPFLLLLALVAAFAAGCGGGDDGAQATSSTPVDQLLKETFSGDKHVSSGRLDVALRVEAQGAAPVQGPIDVRLSGPFESQGKGSLPAFKLDASLRGAGQDFAGGVTSTGDKGYVTYQGTDYVVSDSVFSEFKRGYEQSRAQANGDGKSPSLASLGINPQNWLTNARNAGEAKVGDADTIRITGDVNVPRLLDDVNTLIEKSRSLAGAAAANAPEKLTEAQKAQAAKAVKRLDVEIYTGKDDKILRRMVVDLAAEGQGTSAGQSATVRLDVQLLDVNQGQDISAPSDAKPLDELLQRFGGLGLGLGGSGSGASGAGSGSGAPNADNLQKYSQCIEDAGQDASKARKCADLLAP